MHIVLDTTSCESPNPLIGKLDELSIRSGRKRKEGEYASANLMPLSRRTGTITMSVSCPDPLRGPQDTTAPFHASTHNADILIVPSSNTSSSLTRPIRPRKKAFKPVIPSSAQDCFLSSNDESTMSNEEISDKIR